MQDSLSYLILALIGVIIYLLLTLRKNKEEPKDNTQELNNLKESINTSFNSMSSSFNSLSKDVTRDMTQTLTSVNEKVAAFNTHVESLNESQKGINKILLTDRGTQFGYNNLVADMRAIPLMKKYGYEDERIGEMDFVFK